jgi:biopolymer transport protein ExbD
MAIAKPGKVLLHKIPLHFVHEKVAGGGKKGVDQSIPLVPFIDFLITLVVFLLMSFSASGELVAQQPSITMPTADHTSPLEVAPIISIDDRAVTLDGTRVADAATLAANADVSRIEQLIQNLNTLKQNWQVLHPGDEFPGMVIIQADVNVDFRVIKKVMFSIAQAGFPNISFAVNGFIDFLITLVVFLLASFGSPDTVTARPELVMPTARNAVDLEFAPIVTIDARVVTLDGRRMVETPALGERIALERIEPLVRDLETMRRSWDLLHPRQPFPATLIVQADRATDFRVIESVMFSAAQAGYANISFAVNEGD